MKTPVSTHPGRATHSDPATSAVDTATLLRDLRRKAAPVVALAGARYWPEAELRVLNRFLRTTALRQTADDEARLAVLSEELDRAEPTACPLRRLTAMVDEVVSLVEACVTSTAVARPRTGRSSAPIHGTRRNI